MLKTTPLILAGALVCVWPALAQGPKASSVYKVEFNLREGNRTAETGRHYTILVDANGRGSFHFGDRIPYAAGIIATAQKASTGSAPPAATQIHYADTGVNIDCRVVEMNGRAELHAEIEISHAGGNAGAPLEPVIESGRVLVNATLDLGKPSIIASVDDPATHRKFDAEVTITKVS